MQTKSEAVMKLFIVLWVLIITVIVSFFIFCASIIESEAGVDLAMVTKEDFYREYEKDSRAFAWAFLHQMNAQKIEWMNTMMEIKRRELERIFRMKKVTLEQQRRASEIAMQLIRMEEQLEIMTDPTVTPEEIQLVRDAQDPAMVGGMVHASVTRIKKTP
jgi:hypothetical protein